MTSFRIENVTAFMQWVFASQHSEIHFTTKDAKSTWVNEMSRSSASQSISHEAHGWSSYFNEY